MLRTLATGVVAFHNSEMDAVTEPTATGKRRRWRWIILGIVALALVVGGLLLFPGSQRPVIVTGTHLGGNVFMVTNHSEESVFVNVVVEVRTNGLWLSGPARSYLVLSSHDSHTSFFSGGAGGTVVPTQPWRLHGTYGKQLHGVNATWHALLMYVDFRRHGRAPSFNPFDPRINVRMSTGEFFVNPVEDSTRAQQ